MDAFENKLINVAATGGRHKYIQEGNHRLRLKRFVFRDGYTGKSIIAEMEVVETTNEEDHYPGQTVSDVFKMNKDISIGNYKALVFTVFQLPGVDLMEDFNEASPDEKLTMLKMPYEAQEGTMFAGAEFDCEAVATTTRAGDPFTRLNYSVPEDDEE